jgi:hypothetical protein
MIDKLTPALVKFNFFILSPPLDLAFTLIAWPIFQLNDRPFRAGRNSFTQTDSQACGLLL